MNPIYATALSYARRGIPTFPCDEAKRPRTPNGFKDASTEEAQLAAWFDVEAPPLIGMPTGRLSGIWALDADKKDGIDGQDTIDAWEEEHGPLPDCPTSLTPGGGTHRLFKATTAVRCSAGKLGPGVDVRGDGGYIIIPPSRINGRGYEWEASSGAAGLVEAPEWLMRLVSGPAPGNRDDDEPAQAQEATAEDRRRALSALNAISYDGTSRDVWLEIGMAYHAAGGDLASFDEWCQRQPGYDAESVAKEWASFAPDGVNRPIGPGTLFHRARAAGWAGGVGAKWAFHGAGEAPDAPETGQAAGGEPPRAPGYEFKLNAKGEPTRVVTSLANLVELFSTHSEFRESLRFNELSENIEITQDGATMVVDDSVVVSVRVWVDTALDWAQKPSAALVVDGLSEVARRHSYNPIKDYLEQLVWDGEDRLDYWLDDVCGVARNLYTMGCARKMLIGAVARVMRPGCKLDTLPILIGPQGTLKSTLVRVLVDGKVSDTPAALGSKDSYLALKGAWVLELAELAAMTGREVERVKAFFSAPVDRYRPPYARLTEEHPRKCWFIGTTNDSEFLKDATGSRRFWPLVVAHVDITALKAIRDQLWAEAMHRWRAGEPWHLSEEEESEREELSDIHFVADAWEDPITEYVVGKDYVTGNEVLSKCLNIEQAHMDMAASMRVGRILRGRLGWTRKPKREGNKVIKAYVRP